jgi:hypothetical protein
LNFNWRRQAKLNRAMVGVREGADVRIQREFLVIVILENENFIRCVGRG